MNEMDELDSLRCTLREVQERVTELESRTSLLEGEEDVTLEDWSDQDVELDCDWGDEDDDEPPMHVGPSVPGGEGKP